MAIRPPSSLSRTTSSTNLFPQSSSSTTSTSSTANGLSSFASGSADAFPTYPINISGNFSQASSTVEQYLSTLPLPKQIALALAINFLQLFFKLRIPKLTVVKEPLSKLSTTAQSFSMSKTDHIQMDQKMCSLGQLKETDNDIKSFWDLACASTISVEHALILFQNRYSQAFSAVISEGTCTYIKNEDTWTKLSVKATCHFAIVNFYNFFIELDKTLKNLSELTDKEKIIFRYLVTMVRAVMPSYIRRSLKQISKPSERVWDIKAFQEKYSDKITKYTALTNRYGFFSKNVRGDEKSFKDSLGKNATKFQLKSNEALILSFDYDFLSFLPKTSNEIPLDDNLAQFAHHPIIGLCETAFSTFLDIDPHVIQPNDLINSIKGIIAKFFADIEKSLPHTSSSSSSH